MSDLLSIAELDADGALREAAEDAGSHSRGAFLRRAGVGAGAVMAGGSLLGALPSLASAAVPASDIAILNFALTLEYLEAAFYAQAKSNNVGGSNSDLTAFVNTVSAHEAAHVAFLKKALGSKAVKKPKFNFKDTVTNQKKFQATAQLLEDTGVAAYLGQAANIKSKAILKAAGSILPIEARHASWIRDINSQTGRPGVSPSPAPASFEKPKTKAQVLAGVKATGFIVG